MKPYGRNLTIDKTLALFHLRGGRRIVEIGSIRMRDNIDGDGYSTLAWVRHAEQVYSVDIDPLATALTLEETAGCDNITALTQDGVEFLEGFDQPIDLLYLDAWDAFLPDSAENHLRAYLAAQKNLHPRSLILIDDTDRESGGKGRLVIPRALEDGLSVLLAEQKQTLLGMP
jgi:predicted O-methyltransferase YrrM